LSAFFNTIKDLFKWVGAFLGYFLLGRNLLGGLLGFVVGSFIDNYNGTMAKLKAQGYDPKKDRPEDVFQFYRRQSTQSDFPTMLMALSAAVMKADGKVVKSELDYVKSFFAQQFGANFHQQHLQTLKTFLEADNVPVSQIGSDIRSRLTLEVRLQLLHYLFGIAKADGLVSKEEVRVIESIAGYMGVSSVDFESIKNMFFRNPDSDYKVLGIDTSATDDEIKKAYRKMAIKFHPDKVSQLGEEYKKGAKDKFQEVQNAYENLKKQRGIK
jgi:DnaJ like chaperone protein